MISLCDRLALVVCVGLMIAGYSIALRYYGSLPHIEDEMAFVWQAKIISRGQIFIPSPLPNPKSFPVPFVIDYQGKRFGKYPIGWPVVLALGEWLHNRAIINPMISGISFWLIYRLIKKILDEQTALLAIVLGSVSPFVLMLTGSLLSHSWSLLLTVIFITSWIDAFTTLNPKLPVRLMGWLPTITSSIALGLLALTRPWTAVGISIPFIFHGISILISKKRPEVYFRLASFCLIAGAITALYFVWQYAVTGDFAKNPYVLWWPYDRIGFGAGIGLQPGGFQPVYAKANTLFSIFTLNTDLFGWPVISWIFLPVGFVICIRKLRVWLISISFLSLVITYSFYWTHPQIFGPRYYFEALPALLLLTVAGIRWLAGRAVGKGDRIPWHKGGQLRYFIMTLIVSILVAGNLLYYLPARLQGKDGLNGISQKCLIPLRSFAARNQLPLLVFVHVQKNYHEYSCLSTISSPLEDTQILTAVSRGVEIDRAVANYYNQRVTIHYYPDTGEFYSSPRSKPDPTLEIP